MSTEEGHNLYYTEKIGGEPYTQIYTYIIYSIEMIWSVLEAAARVLGDIYRKPLSLIS